MIGGAIGPMRPAVKINRLTPLPSRTTPSSMRMMCFDKSR